MQPLHVRRAAPVDIKNIIELIGWRSAIDFAIGHPSSISNARLTAEHVIVRYLGGKAGSAARPWRGKCLRIISALTGDANIRIKVTPILALANFTSLGATSPTSATI